MRTTIDLPDELHKQALAIARDTSRTLNQTVADLIRRGLRQEGPAQISVSEDTGLPLVRLHCIITTEDVRALEDEQP